MNTNFLPMRSRGVFVMLANGQEFIICGCDNAVSLAAFIVTACNAHDDLVAQGVRRNTEMMQLRDDLCDARNQRDQLVAALKTIASGLGTVGNPINAIAVATAALAAAGAA